MQAEHSITIHAPIDVVWKTLTDIEQWPQWQKSVSSASLHDALAPSAEFRWASGGMKIQSKITELSALSSIRWIGSTVGTKAEHAWSLVSVGTDTRVTTTESMSGWMVTTIGFFNKHFLKNALKQTLEELKLESERRHAD